MSALLFDMLACLKPPDRILPSKWAEANLVLPRESNQRAGKLRLTALQKGMCDAAAEPAVRELVLMTSAQLGKTTALHAILGWAVCGEGGPILIVRPDEGDVSSYVRETLDPIIAASPALRRLIGQGGADNKNSKTYPGGSIALASSFKASALAGKAVRVALCDELDRFAPVVSTGEGKPEDLVKRRLHTFFKSLLLLSSTPTFAGTSRIAANYERGDKRLFFVQCRHCQDWAPIDQSRLHFEPGKPEGARLLCLACGALADEAERLRMVEAGEWRGTAKGEPGVASMHAPELASEFSSLARVAAQVDGATTLEARKAVANLCWGLPFQATNEIENDPSALAARAEPIEPPYDRRIDFLTSSLDVQSDRLEMMFCGHAGDNRKFILDRVVLNGDTSGHAVWQQADAVAPRSFKVEDGRVLQSSLMFCDGGFQTEMVARFVMSQRAKGRRAYVTFGRAGWNRPAVREGQNVKGLLRGLIVGVDNLKLNVTKALTNSDAAVPGYIHLPAHLDSDAFDQLASESLSITYRRGFPVYAWTKQPHVRNEMLDLLVLNFAAATLVKGRAVSANSNKKSQPSIAERAARLQAMVNARN